MDDSENPDSPIRALGPDETQDAPPPAIICEILENGQDVHIVLQGQVNVGAMFIAAALLQRIAMRTIDASEAPPPRGKGLVVARTMLNRNGPRGKGLVVARTMLNRNGDGA